MKNFLKPTNPQGRWFQHAQLPALRITYNPHFLLLKPCIFLYWIWWPTKAHNKLKLNTNHKTIHNKYHSHIFRYRSDIFTESTNTKKHKCKSCWTCDTLCSWTPWRWHSGAETCTGDSYHELFCDVYCIVTY